MITYTMISDKTLVDINNSYIARRNELINKYGSSCLGVISVSGELYDAGGYPAMRAKHKVDFVVDGKCKCNTYLQKFINECTANEFARLAFGYYCDLITIEEHVWEGVNCVSYAVIKLDGEHHDGM